MGTVNEDFAIESMAGDIFQLGISSWRIRKVEQGKVRVEDARGLPPTIPFWLGEAPARTDELSAAVSELRTAVEGHFPDLLQAQRWLSSQTGIESAAAQQLVEYLWATKKTLGVVPSQQNVVFERFFDESGGMQLVIHSPFGGRINRAWGLALRKRFCRTFNFELQAAANDNSIVLSLGPQHSFPLEEVFAYLKPQTAKDVLTQALLAAPMFQTRWRWNATRSLAVLRWQGGRKVPMPIQRMRSDDLLSAVFPEQTACQENLVGDVEIPDHPIVNEVVRDCLTEAMDVDGFTQILRDAAEKRLNLVAVDSVEPSPMAHEILTAKPYAFLDDAPLEERRTQAVFMRRTVDLKAADDVGQLDQEAIRRVREQAWPEVESVDELHDALLLLGFMTQGEMLPFRAFLPELLGLKRATKFFVTPGHSLFIACEKLPQFQAIMPGRSIRPVVEPPPRERAVDWTPEDAMREIIRSRLEGLGPVTVGRLADSLGVPERDVDRALIALEGEGFAIRGQFEFRDGAVEWCDRRSAGADSPLHAGPAAEGSGAGVARRFHALSVRLAPPGPGIPGGRADGADGAVGPTGGLSSAGVGVGESSATGADEPVQQRMAGPALSVGAGGVGAIAPSVEFGRRTSDEYAAQLAGGADIPRESLVSSGVGAGDVRRKGPAQRTWLSIYWRCWNGGGRASFRRLCSRRDSCPAM